MSVEPKQKKLFSIKNILIGSGVLLIFCCALGFVLTQLFPSEPGAATQVAALPTEIIPAEPTEEIAPTDPPQATNTPEPTDTPEPTSTPLPTNTPTPVPEPIEYSGSGDSVVELEKWSGPALLQITSSGSGNFAVWSYDANGNQIDLLVNTIGKYQGTRPIEFSDYYEPVTRLSVESSGSWQINVLPLAMIRKEPIPGTISGTGDDVIYLEGDNPDLLIADASQAESNFAVFTYGDDIDLLINEIAPYTGTLPISSDTIIIEVHAEGPWSIEITTR